MMLRTPDSAFAVLPDFPYEPRYVTLADHDNARMHYVEAGTGDEVILCLHGEPTWSFLYRKMIAPLSQHYRVVAPDMIGFGRSDKYPEIEDYSYRMHHNTLVAFIRELDLRSITLVCQDWGGILGLPIASELQERFARLVIMNTGLPSGDAPMPEGFMAWRDFAERTGRSIMPGQLMKLSCVSGEPAPEVLAAYDAPFPDDSYRAGVAAFPLLIPLKPDDPGADVIRAGRERLAVWDKPALVMFSDSDPVTRGGDRFFRHLIPTAAAQPEITITGAGHFLQEERGDVIAAHIHDFIQRA